MDVKLERRVEKEELFTSSAALHNDDPFAATGLTAMRIDYECNWGAKRVAPVVRRVRKGGLTRKWTKMRRDGIGKEEERNKLKTGELFGIER